MRDLVLKSNMLVMSNLSELKINELRFLDFYLSRLNPKSEDIKKARFISFTKAEFLEVMGLHPKTNMKGLKKALDSLQSRKIVIPYKTESEDCQIRAVLFPTVDIHTDRETNHTIISMACNTDVQGLFFQLKGYISYALRYMIALGSGPAILLYNRLKYQCFLGDTWTISVGGIREALGLRTKAYDEFKYVKRVIDEAVGEINEKTDLEVSVSVVKDGKWAKDLIFGIKRGCEKKAEMILEDTETPHEEIITLYQESSFEGAFDTKQTEAIVSAYVVSGKSDPYSADPATRLKVCDHLSAIYKRALAKKDVEDKYSYVLKVVDNLKKRP